MAEVTGVSTGELELDVGHRQGVCGYHTNLPVSQATLNLHGFRMHGFQFPWFS